MRVERIWKPSAEELVAFLHERTRAGGALLQVAGAMEVVYQGRAASSADAGDYLLLLKPDGALMVHAARGIKPLNWQPRCDDLAVFLDDAIAVLIAERRTPHEVVRIAFLDPAFALAMHPQEQGGFVLQGSEAQMQRALARRPEWIEPGLTLLEAELPTGVGGVDLYARDAEGQRVVVELKRGRASHEAVHQLQRYVERIRNEANGDTVRGILAAPMITAPARTRLQELGLEYVEVTALPDDEDDGVVQPSLF